MGLVKKEPSLASLLPTAPSRNQRRTSFGLSRKQFETRRVIFMLRIAENMKLINKAIISSYLIFIKRETTTNVIFKSRVLHYLG